MKDVRTKACIIGRVVRSRMKDERIPLTLRDKETARVLQETRKTTTKNLNFRYLFPLLAAVGSLSPLFSPFAFLRSLF